MYNLMVCRDTKHIDNSHPCSFTTRVPGGSMTWSLDLAAHTSLSPIRHGFAPSFAAYQKGCTRLAAASDNVYQRLAQGRWFSPGTPASSTTKAKKGALDSQPQVITFTSRLSRVGGSLRVLRLPPPLKLVAII